MLNYLAQNSDILKFKEFINLWSQPTRRPFIFLIQLRPLRWLLLVLVQLLTFFISSVTNRVKLSENKMSINSPKFWLIIYLLHFDLKFWGKYLHFESNNCGNISQRAWVDCSDLKLATITMMLLLFGFYLFKILAYLVLFKTKFYQE